MADVYMYADETGNLDYNDLGGPRSTAYFGFGTAIFKGSHGAEMFEGMQLRARLEAKGVTLPSGFHAVNDAHSTRHEVSQLIRTQAPRFDTTFLLKAGAYDYVRAKGQMYLYRMAWYQHFKEIAQRVSAPGDTLYVVVGTFGTAARRTQAREALEAVCKQVDRQIVLCVWDSATSWGLQVADYGLWATQRVLEGRTCAWYSSCIQPTIRTAFTPWGLKSPPK